MLCLLAVNCLLISLPLRTLLLSRIFRSYSCWQADPGPLISLLLLFSKLPSEPEMPRGSCGWLGTSGNEQVKETREFSQPNNFPLFFFFKHKYK